MKEKIIENIFGFSPIKCGGFSALVLGIADDEDIIIKAINPSDENISVLSEKGRADLFQKIQNDLHHERSLISKISHKNIIKYIDAILAIHLSMRSNDYEVFELLKNSIICFEFADQTLRDLICTRQLSIYYALFIIKQIAKALTYLHNDVFDRRIVIHGDIKPENIFLHKYGQVKLGDFGSAQIAYPFVWSQPKSVTPFYKAPEMDKGKIDSAGDIWACGILLLEMMMGRKKIEELFDGNNLSLNESEQRSQILNNIKNSGIDQDIFDLLFKKILVEHPKRVKNGKQLLDLFSSSNSTITDSLREILLRVEIFEQTLEKAIELDSIIRLRIKSEKEYSPESDLTDIIDMLENLIDSVEKNDFDFIYCFYAQVLLLCFDCVFEERISVKDMGKFLHNAHNKAYGYLTKAREFNPNNTYYLYTFSKLAYIDYLLFSKDTKHLKQSLEILLKAVEHLPRKIYIDSLISKYKELESLLLKNKVNKSYRDTLNQIDMFWFNNFGPMIQANIVKKEQKWRKEKRYYQITFSGIGESIPNYKLDVYPQALLCDGLPIDINIVKKHKDIIFNNNFVKLDGKIKTAIIETTLKKRLFNEFSNIDVLFGINRRRVKYVICNIKQNENKSTLEGVLFVCIGDLLDAIYVGKITPKFQFVFDDQIPRKIRYFPQLLEFNPYDDDSDIILGKNLNIEITPKIDPNKTITFDVDADFS